ncbi:MAG: hypothetical protein MHM6MM_002978 [Cercozoa sp. M6MM]
MHRFLRTRTSLRLFSTPAKIDEGFSALINAKSVAEANTMLRDVQTEIRSSAKEVSRLLVEGSDQAALTHLRDLRKLRAKYSRPSQFTARNLDDESVWQHGKIADLCAHIATEQGINSGDLSCELPKNLETAEPMSDTNISKPTMESDVVCFQHERAFVESARAKIAASRYLTDVSVIREQLRAPLWHSLSVVPSMVDTVSKKLSCCPSSGFEESVIQLRREWREFVQKNSGAVGAAVLSAESRSVSHLLHVVDQSTEATKDSLLHAASSALDEANYGLSGGQIKELFGSEETPEMRVTDDDVARVQLGRRIDLLIWRMRAHVLKAEEIATIKAGSFASPPSTYAAVGATSFGGMQELLTDETCDFLLSEPVTKVRQEAVELLQSINELLTGLSTPPESIAAEPELFMGLPYVSPYHVTSWCAHDPVEAIVVLRSVSAASLLEAVECATRHGTRALCLMLVCCLTCLTGAMRAQFRAACAMDSQVPAPDLDESFWPAPLATSGELLFGQDKVQRAYFGGIVSQLTSTALRTVAAASE